MNDPQNIEKRPVNPRRKQRSQVQIFKEAYLPVIIAGAALLLIIIFIIGSIVRSVQRKQFEAQASYEASVSEAAQLALWQQEANTILKSAETYASHFDYEKAVSTIDGFSGEISQFPALQQNRQSYAQAKEQLIQWNNPDSIPNLSFQLLIENPTQAFSDRSYSVSYNKNFITTDEFFLILEQLYENNYVLVSLSDIESGKILLPTNKKPLVITQTQVNYYTYMIDSDGDKLPDKGCAGFASRLVLDANGNITCEMVDSTGQTVTGPFDLVPILDAFIETHPDFSYKGAKAVLALTGYDGLFGYRTNPQAKSFFGEAYYEQACKDAAEIAKVLRNTGYELACYTYENVAYGTYSPEQIREDLTKWNIEVTPILGDVNTFVFARNSDISEGNAPYSGDKYAEMQDFGFTRFLGFSTNGKPWYTPMDGQFRQGRILVSGSNLAYHKDWFTGLFDPSSVLDSIRGTIPS